MALSQGQMRVVGVVLTIILLGGAGAIVFHQMKQPAKVLVVDTGLAAPPQAAAAPIARGKPVSGVIESADGKPVAQAEVVLVPEGFGFDLSGPRPQNFPIARSDKDGKFDFGQPAAWADLVVISDAGFAFQVTSWSTTCPSRGRLFCRY